MIYEIVCNVTGERYIGSTFRPIEERIREHRNDAKRKRHIASEYIINRNDYTYSILENVDTDSKDELRQCELKWYNQLENINKFMPYIVDKKAYSKQQYENNKAKILLKAKEYYKEHAEEKKKKTKEYYKKNAEKVKEYNRQYYKTSTQIKMSA